MSNRESSESPPGSSSRSIASSTSSHASPTPGVRKVSPSTGLSPRGYLAHRGPQTPPATRLFTNVQQSSSSTGASLSSSPLSASSSAQSSHRRRQDSVSSSVSGTTDPTSYEESGSECMSTDGGGGAGGGNISGGEARETLTSSANPKQPPAFSPPSSATTTAAASGLGATRRYGGPSPLSTQDLLPGGAGLAPAGSSAPASSTVSSPPASSFPIPISATIPSSSVRLSTTPLFPSPLAQASGPVEERHGGDDGDSDIEEEDEDAAAAWNDKGQAGQSLAQAPEPFGEMEFSPPPGQIDLPDASSSSSEANITPRASNRSRPRPSASSVRELSPEQDGGRTARAGRVRAPSTRASGLSMVLNASGDEASPSKRRSRDFAGWTGMAVESRSAGSSPSRSSSNSFDPVAVSPPSPSSSLSISPTSASRRSSISYPRGFQPGSPTTARSLRASVAPLHAGISIPQPFPAAPPPHESIKLQKVPESVRTALEFRQQSAAYNGEPMSMPETHGFGKFGAAVLDSRLPKTPVATRAPSPASPPSSHSSHSPAASRPASRQPSRQSSREHLATLSVSPPVQSTSSASSAFAPLFPLPISTPPLSGPTRSARDRARSVAMPGGSPSVGSSPLSKSSSPPTFNPVFVSDALAPSGLSVSVSSSSPLARRAHQASGSISGGFGNAGPFEPGSRLSAHRMSLAPSMGLGAPGDGTDEYAQIIMSTRNAKMRKWKGSGPAVSTLEAGTIGAGSTFIQAGGQYDGAEPSDQGGAAQPETREIEWVDWLDEYRKLKEAKLRADQEGDTSPEREKPASDEDGQSTEGEGKGKKKPKEKKSTTPSPPRRSDSFQPAEPALAAAQKGKAKATTTDYNPFESTSAPPTSLMSQGFLTPSLPMRHDYFPLAAVSEGIGAGSTEGFQPFPTPTPMSSAESYEFAPLQSVTSTGGSSVSNYGSPGAKRKRNFTKLGNKIDAWWSAVRTSFAGAAEERETRPRRTSTEQPRLARMPTLEPMPSRTSSQFLRPATPGTPGLRNVASATDLPRSSAPITSGLSAYQSGVVPTGPLAPSARVDSHRRKPSPTGVVPSSTEDTDPNAATRTRRNPHLSLNLGPELNQLAPRHRSPSPRPSGTTADVVSNAPPLADIGPQGQTSLPIPVPTAIPSPAEDPRMTPGYSPVLARTPGLVPTASPFPMRDRKSMTTPAPVRPKVSKDGKVSSFSMQTVRQQIRQRLASAKENCDKELRRIITDITAYVETEMHRDVHTPLPPSLRQIGALNEMQASDRSRRRSQAAVFDFDDSGSEAVADVEETFADDLPNTDSDGASTSIAPSRTKTPRGPTMSPQGDRRRSLARGPSPRRANVAPRQRHLTSMPREGNFLGERKARSPPASNPSSRSASHSRSHSPLPPGSSHRTSGSRSPAYPGAGHLSSDSPELAESAFIVLLQEIITIATEVLDTPISKLTKAPGTCAEYISRVQQIGDAWSENPELPCRGWYVQLLLAVAGLSRVVEWWEAEKGFWSFEEGVDDSGEPILFIAKPTVEESPEPRSRDVSISSQPSLPVTGHQQPPTWSPLGIDLGERPAAPEKSPLRHAREPSSVPADTESQARVGDLHQAVDTIRAQTLLMELSLNGQLFQYLSSAWQDLVGVEPDECLDMPISDFLYPDDAAVFAEATRQLEADDSHTVEVSFRLRVASASETSQDDNPPEDLYEAMEGKGMLMLDGLTGSASHTMWVVRPAPVAEAAEDEASQSLARYGLDGLHWRAATDPALLIAPGRLMLDPILCRICERPTPAWFFEKHNETCNAVHRLEGDISDCNDRLRELLTTVETLASSLNGATQDSEIEYAGIPLNTSPAATPPTYLNGRRASLAPRSSPNASPSPPMQTRIAQQRVFDHVQEILQIAISISTPSVTDDSGAIPIYEQRLLSPNSENNLAAVMRWQRPPAEEQALIQLVCDTEDHIRFKLNSVNRLRNTILYAEKVRQEWEAKAQEAMAAMQIATREQSRERGPSPLPFDSPQLQPVPSHESPRQIDALDLQRPGAEMRRRLSQPLSYLSPTLGPDEASIASSSPGAAGPMSPRIPAAVPSSRTRASSIKDFKVIKPISKGAFGSVYLAKKITTGDYYAIKVLKKSDMVAKNQVTNVKAERMILMTQTDSEFVVKLFYTFQSKDYLYLVMEYLPGGDCAALVKNLGGLPEDWAKRYIAEVIVGLNHLHEAGIIHRDLKPDNLLIDSKGHLKLTDFGLSRIGLLGRQTQLPSLRDARRPAGLGRNGSELSTSSSPLQTPGLVSQSQAGYFGNVPITDSFSLDTPSDGSGSSAPGSSHAAKMMSPTGVPGSAGHSVGVVGPPGAAAETPQQHFVGTPDYLAPESILGVGMDAGVDWWALGVICYEFLYGIPPFHDETPEKVFENILSRKLEWHEDVMEITPEARDFIDRLLVSDPARRLGAKGAHEVKAHPFLDGVDWDNLLLQPVDFVPQVNDPESTDYFDPRGATGQEDYKEKDAEGADEVATSGDTALADDPAIQQMRPVPTPFAETVEPPRAPRDRSETAPAPNQHDDFGTFNFRNLTVLKQANDDVIRKLKDEQLLPPGADALSPLKVSTRFPGGPTSPASASTSSASSSLPFSTSNHNHNGSTHSRQSSGSQLSPNVERLRTRQPSLSISMGGHGGHQRRNSLPSRLRRGSISSSLLSGERPRVPSEWQAVSGRRRGSAQMDSSDSSSPSSTIDTLAPLQIPGAAEKPTAPIVSSAPDAPAPISTSLEASFSSSPMSASPAANRLATIDCLVAGRNPIVTKVLETMLKRLGCRVVVVPNGAEAILAAGGIPFDVLFLDLAMPVVDGEKAARMIKSTVNPSANSPIVAVCSQPAAVDDAAGTLFAGILCKPIMKADLLAVLSHLGFKLEVKTHEEDSQQSSPTIHEERRSSA
ncbi:hypothetical protein JCM10908_000689 [Rhodotorula pacifica]|uniref:uncharacterized protein n=1 Tax=Rhodotorula pacifica TaxID=1495444 RepID=UPI003174639C